MGKTIIISNRLPVKIAITEEGYTLQQSEGGLATGLDSVFSKSKENIWIGWPGVVENDRKMQQQITGKLEKMNLLPVFLSKKQVEGFYTGFSNATLWPLFHYMPTFARYKDSYWEMYKEVNQRFADIIKPLIETGDRIWIHDYHLLLLPDMIRAQAKGKDLSIGFFQHIPFPSFEIFRLLPWRHQIMEGMMGADLLGFHTIDDVNHFIDSAARILGARANANIITYHQHAGEVDAFPMGIDYNKFNEYLPAQKETQKHLAELKQQYQNVKLILSIDRLDYSKGILPRLHAIELLLETHPEFKEKISLFMIVVPSRDNIAKYKELKDEIDKLAGNINAKFRTLNWQPIQYFYQSFPPNYLSALYQIAEICLVTPMRDGMNLVCKEYVASRTKENGVLILSEMAGASRELADALIVNPNNIRQIAENIITGLKMSPARQKQRMHRMREIVKKFNIEHWVKIFLENMAEVKEYQTSLTTKYIKADSPVFRKAFDQATTRAIILDYDGTLVGFNNNPTKAVPDKELYGLLQKLIENKRNKVLIVSGRNHETLNKWFGKLPIDLIGEHGVWTRFNKEKWNAIQGITDDWKAQIYPRLNITTDRTPGSFIEEKSYSLVWHYRNADAELGKLRANELISQLSYSITNKGLQVLFGDKVVEIKSTEINKGKAIEQWMSQLPVKPTLTVSFGDDYTDEDIFNRLTGKLDFTIKVGQKISKAKYYVLDYRDVRNFLKKLE